MPGVQGEIGPEGKGVPGPKVSNQFGNCSINS